MQVERRPGAQSLKLNQIVADLRNAPKNQLIVCSQRVSPHAVCYTEVLPTCTHMQACWGGVISSRNIETFWLLLAIAACFCGCGACAAVATVATVDRFPVEIVGGGGGLDDVMSCQRTANTAKAPP